MAQQGLRLLGVAQARLTKQETDPWPPSPREIPFQWLGLLALADPIRPQVPEAIAQCVQAGIRVVMITGDHPQTAAGIARQIGLDSPGGILTGADLATLSGDSLSQRLEGVNLFARVLPEQKLTIVTALKARGEVVAMTGDGVNDAPALKAAHIGVAMGARGTDVAREASALVLLEDDFSAMVSAIRLGRRIYDNIQKALHFIISVHLPIVALSLLPVVFHWPLILLPMHIVFLELIIDPACSIVFEAEPEEADVMSRPPRPVTAAVLDRPALGLSLLQGGMIMLGVIALLVGGLQQQMAQETLRSMAFTTLVFSNLLLVVENRSWTQSLRQLIAHPNPALGWMTGVTLALLGLIFAVPWLRQGFQLAPLSLEQVGLCIGLSIVSVLWFEGFKAWAHRRTPAGG
jgi:Ca2+-transporting ATPase